MGKCITSTTYLMKADIYTPSVSQDATGAVVKTWTFSQTINCMARGILRKGVGDNSVAVSLDDYINVFVTSLKMRSAIEIPTNYRVVNIRNDNGTIYTESQDPSSEGGLSNATIFEPRGSTPLISFDGTIMEYETVLVKQEIQKMVVS